MEDGDDDRLVREMEKELEGLDAEFVSGKMGAFGDKRKEEKVLQQLERIRKKQWDLAMVQVTVEDHRIMEPNFNDQNIKSDLEGDTEGTEGSRGTGNTGSGKDGEGHAPSNGDNTYDRMTQYFLHQEQEFDTLRNQLGVLGAEIEDLTPMVVSLDAAERRYIGQH